MGVRLDPRAKLYLLLLGNLTLFLHISLAVEIILVGLYLSLFCLAGKTKNGLRMGMIYGVLLSIDLWVIPIADGILLNVLSLLSVGIRMMLNVLSQEHMHFPPQQSAKWYADCVN